jgi:hypothetical protein
MMLMADERASQDVVWLDEALTLVGYLHARIALYPVPLSRSVCRRRFPEGIHLLGDPQPDAGQLPLQQASALAQE